MAVDEEWILDVLLHKHLPVLGQRKRPAHHSDTTAPRRRHRLPARQVNQEIRVAQFAGLDLKGCRRVLTLFCAVSGAHVMDRGEERKEHASWVISLPCDSGALKIPVAGGEQGKEKRGTRYDGEQEERHSRRGLPWSRGGHSRKWDA